MDDDDDDDDDGYVGKDGDGDSGFPAVPYLLRQIFVIRLFPFLRTRDQRLIPAEPQLRGCHLGCDDEDRVAKLIAQEEERPVSRRVSTSLYRPWRARLKRILRSSLSSPLNLTPTSSPGCQLGSSRQRRACKSPVLVASSMSVSEYLDDLLVLLDLELASLLLAGLSRSDRPDARFSKLCTLRWTSSCTPAPRPRRPSWNSRVSCRSCWIRFSWKPRQLQLG
eukprot:760537-Hanusia_phi.AAC.4